VSGPLAGVTVVVTRPAAQAGRFLELATRAGARCLAFPTLQIVRLSLDPSTVEAVERTPWDWAIYTSTNAVEAAAALFPRPLARHHAAVGRATARALEQRGVTIEARPDSANSEGLLAMPMFAQPAGLHVLLVKGAGGRDVLRETLTARGAVVRALDVYRREPVRPDATAHAELAASTASTRERLVLTVTSGEVLQALLQSVDPTLAVRLRDKPLLVPGPRVAAAAASLGWRGEVVQAPTAEDDAMLGALQRYVTGPTRDAC
jgi:uroporphyrinogen-III synthase